MGLAFMVIALGAVAAICELVGEGCNFILTPDDHDAIEWEGP